MKYKLLSGIVINVCNSVEFRIYKISFDIDYQILDSKKGDFLLK